LSSSSELRPVAAAVPLLLLLWSRRRPDVILWLSIVDELREVHDDRKGLPPYIILLVIEALQMMVQVHERPALRGHALCAVAGALDEERPERHVKD
jgi:hypothetical protein